MASLTPRRAGSNNTFLLRVQFFEACLESLLFWAQAKAASVGCVAVFSSCSARFVGLHGGASREEAGVDLRKAKATDKKTKRRKAKNVGVQVSVSGKESASDKRRYASQIQRRREREAVKTI